MRINVKLFAILRDKAGASELQLDLPDGATAATAIDALKQKVPAIADHARSAAYAVNQNYVPPSTVLNDNDELAIIPPVSGG
jgi:MoaE-MoaD fusion protein